MNLQIMSTKDGCVHVAVKGKLTQDSSSRDQDLLVSLLGPEAYALTVLMNLQDTDFIDSSGIGWMVGCHKRFREQGGRLIVYSAPPTVANVLKLMRIDQLFDNAANAAEAERIAGVHEQ